MFIGKRNNKIVSFVRAQIPTYTFNPFTIQMDDLLYQKNTSKFIKKKSIKLLTAKFFTIKNPQIMIDALLSSNDNATDKTDAYQFTQNGFELHFSKLQFIPYYRLSKTQWFGMQKNNN